MTPPVAMVTTPAPMFPKVTRSPLTLEKADAVEPLSQLVVAVFQVVELALPAGFQVRFGDCC